MGNLSISLTFKKVLAKMTDLFRSGPVSIAGILIILLSSHSVLAQASGYSYGRAITIDHRRVMNTDLTDFPVLISGIFPYLATVANGGKLQNPNGYDVLFTADSAGQNALDYEIDSYDPTTGKVAFWVRIPLLSHTADTSVYMWYGNNTIVSSQENKGGVWRSGYTAVWHLSNPTNPTDSLGLHNGTNHGTVSGVGVIGAAASLSNSYITSNSAISLAPTSTLTESVWVRMNALPTSGRQDAEFSASSVSGDFAFSFQINGSNWWAGPGKAGIADQLLKDPNTVTAGTWHQLVLTLNNGSFSFYRDGNLVGTQAFNSTTASAAVNTKNWALGTAIYSGNNYYYLNGSEDEARVSNVVRSADWISTEYNNQSSPQTFFFVSPTEFSGSSPIPYSIVFSPVSFSYSRPITIDHRQVSNSDQVDFPVLISGTFPYLANVANGGRLQNLNGYDLVFSSDTAGQNQLDHELDSYDPVTGKIALWVRIPLLSHQTDTTIYMWYGSGAVIASQENKPGVWRNGYQLALHLPNGSVLTATDSSVSANNCGANNAAASSGVIGGGASLNGSAAQYLACEENGTSLDATGAYTISGWINYTAGGGSLGTILIKNTGSAKNGSYLLRLNTGGNSTSTLVAGMYSSGWKYFVSNVAIKAGRWYKLDEVWDGSSIRLFIDGVQDPGSVSLTGPVSTNTDPVTIGQNGVDGSPSYFKGLLDEIRVAPNVARSADWIVTEYNNQSSPGTFAYVSPTEYTGTPQATYPLIPPPANSYAFSRAITVDHHGVVNSDQTDFPILISGTFPFLATATNGGRVQNANGYDIVLTSDAAGQNRLDHEIDSYDPVTGNAAFWVRVPVLSHSTDTQLYMWYGNGSVTSSQENKPGVWQNGYIAVWHALKDDLFLFDSTANANNGWSINGVSSAPGWTGSGIQFTGSNYIRVQDSPSLRPTSAETVEQWVKPTSTGNCQSFLSKDYWANGSWSSPYESYYLGLGGNCVTIVTTTAIGNSGGNSTVNSSGAIPFGSWAFLAGTYDGNVVRNYTNGILDGYAAKTGPIGYGAARADLSLGMRSPYTPQYYSNATADEIRISNVARSSDWIATEYNNQGSPANFVFISPNESSNTLPNPYSLNPSPTTFSYARGIVISKQQVSGSDQTDFPVLISGTFPYLANILNGGRVQNTNGYDIVFTSDAAGQNRLDHEIDSYDPATGNAAFWVRIPLLSHSTDTQLYIWYGNPSVISSQENKPGVWMTGYVAVWHGLSSTGLPDSTNNGNNGANVNAALAVTGRIGRGIQTNGSSSYIRIADSPSLRPTNAVTIEEWINPTNTGNCEALVSKSYAAGSWVPPYVSYYLGLGCGIGTTATSVTTSTNLNATSNSSVPYGAWSFLAGTYDGTATRNYVNGVQNGYVAQTGPLGYGSAPADLSLGMRSPYDRQYYSSGIADEIRISNVARSADWITTEYNNQNSPGTFVSICTEEAFDSIPDPCFPLAPPSSYSYSRPVTISHLQVSNTDQADFPVLISGTFPYLATAANSGEVQNANGYDIVFTSDSAGQTRLDHEIDSYDPVTGNAIFWVRVPVLSHSTDTQIYIWYGNSSVVSSQENRPGVWKNGYVAVWHGPKNLVLADSTSNDNNGSLIGATAATGRIGMGIQTAGSSSSYTRVPDSPSLRMVNAITIEEWVNPTRTGNCQGLVSKDYTASGNWVSPYASYYLGLGGPSCTTGLTATAIAVSGANAAVTSSNEIPFGSWSFLTGTYDGTTIRNYINGVQDGYLTQAGSISYGAVTADLALAMASPYTRQYSSAGIADEIRVSNVARSADWILTEYNNQNTPNTFAAVGGSQYFWIATTALPQATQYFSYSAALTASNGTAPYTWSVVSGALPPGFSLDPNSGAITGTDQSTGNYIFTVQVQDAALNTATRQLTIIVNAPPPIAITNNSPIPGAALNVAYNTNLTATGGVPPYTWSITSGTLPTGLTLNSDTGMISGTPTAIGTSAFTVQVQDTKAVSITKDLNIRVFSADSLTPPAAAVGGSITVNGTGFGATQGSGLVRFNGVTAGISSWTDSAITAVVPQGAQSGNVTVTIDGGSSPGLPFTLEGSPTITSLSPSSGNIGTQVTITGSGFGSSQSNSVVTFDGIPATTISSWSDNTIKAEVAVGTSSGQVTIQVAGLTGYGPNFVVASYVTITDSLGNQSYYSAEIAGGKWYVNVAQGGGCSACTIQDTIQRSYDLRGNLLTTLDELGRTTSYSYDGNDNVATLTQPAVNSVTPKTTYTYNSFGEVLTMTDPLGNVTTNTYDAKGNLLTVTTPKPDANTAASVTTFGYDTKGELTTITDPLSHVTTIAYNSVGLIQSITDANNKVTSYEYDAQGNRTAVVDALQHRTTFAYDAGNRLTTITYPDSTTVTFGYDYRGRRTSVTDQNSKVTTYAYDDADRLTSVTDADNKTTQYAYDTENNLTSITDALGRITSFTYDPKRRVTEADFPSSYSELYGYDAVGNLTSKTDRKSQTITYVYDALNRLTHKGYPDSTGVDYVYDLVGKIQHVNDPTGTYSFAYDNMGRLIGTTTQYSFLPGSTFSNAYTYDAASNRKTFTAPDGSTNNYSYDVLNRMTDLTNSWAGHFGFGYDDLSRRTQLAKPNGISTNYAYDSVSRLLSVLHQAGTTTVDGASYTNDNAGNRTSKQNLLTGITDNYSYDPIYQLTQVLQGTSTTEAYAYDDVGNRLSDVSSSGWQYNSSNQLTSTPSVTNTYDQNGNTLTKADSSGTTQYNWDIENRLTSVTLPGSGGTVSFKYDPFGRRIEKVTASGTTNYVYDGANFIAEYDASGALLAKYAQGAGIDEPLTISRGGQVGYYNADGLGSITSVIDNTLTPLATYTYDAFGKKVTTGGGLINPFQYTGREWDQETGLYYYRARYYDPSTGRFINEDPIRFRGGINFYAYVANGPATFFDPTGLKKKCKDLPCDTTNLRLVPIYVQEGNHEINYSLMTVDGKPAPGQFYVFEHQTQAGGKRIQVGPKDYVSPSVQNNSNYFDDLLTTGLDSVQTFTISADPVFDPDCQHSVIIRYGDGRDYGSQHIWRPHGIGPVMINNYPTLPVWLGR